VGSHPDEVDFFKFTYPSSHTMALGSTQPLTEMSTRNLFKRKKEKKKKKDRKKPWGKGRPARRADNLAAIC
jgi:hypothetical protein